MSLQPRDKVLRYLVIEIENQKILGRWRRVDRGIRGVDQFEMPVGVRPTDHEQGMFLGGTVPIVPVEHDKAETVGPESLGNPQIP